MPNTFLPNNYKIPSTSNYMKFAKGENKFRILSEAIVGYEYWTADRKPVRLHEMPDSLPDDIGYSENKKTGEQVPNTIRHFWAFVVWNYTDERIQILEITQATVMAPLQKYVQNPKWGDYNSYDISVTREGDGLDSSYTVTVDPKSDIEAAIKTKWDAAKATINLPAMFESKDPFTTSVAPTKSTKVGASATSEGIDYPQEEINPDDIPF